MFRLPDKNEEMTIGKIELYITKEQIIMIPDRAMKLEFVSTNRCIEMFYSYKTERLVPTKIIMVTLGEKVTADAYLGSVNHKGLQYFIFISTKTEGVEGI
jgi:hypothetical protein